LGKYNPTDQPLAMCKDGTQTIIEAVMPNGEVITNREFSNQTYQSVGVKPNIPPMAVPIPKHK
jgi:hypothetical protein